MRYPFALTLLLTVLGSVRAADIDFNRQVRPILLENCLACHGPDEKTRKADLRLDTKEGVLSLGNSGETVVVPGQHSKSELYRRLIHPEARKLMPPAKSGKKLTAEQIGILKDWIDQGAKWSSHWAFVTPKRPAIPVNVTGNPIDYFIQRRLANDGLKLSPEASRETLLRRVSLDLIGLPPTPQQVDDFLKDKSPNAYEKVVDRLLASPHYGERQAMPWLDYARYADSNGFQTDSSRTMWPWRDWVIDAYNSNKPFDEFTVEQLAGDLLPNATHSQIVATGFNRNHRLNGEGGIIGEEWRIENIIDRVETTGLTWLGLTLGCARCHEHKYDPISQKEFYQLFAYFNNVTESGTLAGNRTGGNTDPIELVISADQEKQRKTLLAMVKHAEEEVARKKADLPKLVAEWEPEFRKQIQDQKSIWSPFIPATVTSRGGATMKKQSDDSYLVSGKNANKDVYTLTGPLAAGPFSGILLECFTDPSLPAQSLGRYPNGNFVLTHVEAEISDPSSKKLVKVRLTRAVADFSQQGWNIANVIGADKSKGWAVDGPNRKENRKAMFLADEPTEVPAGATLTVRLIQESLDKHNIGRFRVSTTSVAPSMASLQGTTVPGGIRELLDLEPAKRTAKQNETLIAYYRKEVPNPVRKADQALEDAEQAVKEFEKKLPTVMVMREGATRDAFLLQRGQYDQRGEKVSAKLPEVFGSLPANAPNNRLGLARWIVSPTNPLTARVWVNRVWERYFGQGIVKSSDNFGTQAEFPSHPELLDWLATEFLQQKWNMKAMHKLIVMSQTYRQSSEVSPELLEKDPENRLLARGPRIRLSGEMVRDQAMAISGLLNPKLGGPPVHPYMPEGVWDETSVYGDLRNYKRDKNDNIYRRSMYTIWKRTAAPPTLQIFDAPNREICVIRRSRTNTPLQALSLMNEITFVEAARKLAERIMKEGGATPEQRLAYGFKLATGRAAKPGELKVLVEGYQQDLARFRKLPEQATQLLKVGDSKPASDLDVPELAAYTLAGNVLLNLDEVVTRE